MSLTKFFQIIDRTFVGKIVEKKLNILKETDPDRIYVENIRSFYNLPYGVAQYFCEMGVKQHLLRRKIGVYCPTCGRMVMSVTSVNEIPETIVCDVCEDLERETHKFIPKRKDLTVFYQLIPKSHE